MLGPSMVTTPVDVVTGVPELRILICSDPVAPLVSVAVMVYVPVGKLEPARVE
jgi:hypothetical protein